MSETPTGLKTASFTFTSADSARLVSLYAKQRNDELAAELLKVWRTLSQTTFVQVSLATLGDLDEFVGTFLFLMTRADFVLSEVPARDFIKINALIANVVAISSFKNTDAWLGLVGRQQNNLARLLALYSARNTVRIDRKLLFDANPTLAALWYTAFVSIYHSAVASEECLRHLQDHLVQIDPRFTHLHQFHHTCFAASYIDPERDHVIKRHVNNVLRGVVKQAALAIESRPNPRRIAVLTNRWFPSHSVYRNQQPWIQALAADYDLVLLHLGPMRPDTDKSMFKEVHELSLDGPSFGLEKVRRNDFAMAYYPEVGMCVESIFLSNVRLAPIQVTSYGHSVSTFGADIDYWIGGADTELIEEIPNNYSERVVLVPGLGIANTRPGYERQRLPVRTDRLVVNGSWYPQKVNHSLLSWVEAILARSPDHVLLRLFSGGGLMESNHFLPFVRAVTERLGAHRVEILPGLPYRDYMARMEEGALCLDAYHYGGCNTVVDSVHLRKPIITYSGKKWYNRIGGAILRKIGMGEMVAESSDEYIEKSVRLINDAAWRQDLTERLEAIDVDALLYDLPEDGRDFKHAIDFLMTHHDRLKQDGTRSPITAADMQLASTGGA